MSWWETLHLVTWWKRLGISAIKTGQDAPSWIWCTERLSFFGGGHIVLQRFVHVRCHFQPLPTKLVFAYFDRGSYVCSSVHSYHEQHLRMGVPWPAFLGVNAWSDNIEEWILSHFTLAQRGRTNSFACSLAFTGKSNSRCLNVPYEFLHWRFSPLLNSENCLHLTM